jgi:hypothetical protein
MRQSGMQKRVPLQSFNQGIAPVDIKSGRHSDWIETSEDDEEFAIRFDYK